jgi:Helix-turn-helix domain
VLGVESNYTNGRARLYALDTGVAAVPPASGCPLPASSPEPAELPEGLFPLGTVVVTPGAIERTENHGMNPAELLRAPVATLRYWRHPGTGPRSFRLGRHVLFRRDDLHRWIDERHEQAGPGRP